MKVFTERTKPVFDPVVITIHIESEKELQHLRTQLARTNVHMDLYQAVVQLTESVAESQAVHFAPAAC